MRACQRSHSGTETNWMEKTKTSWRTTCLCNTHRIHGAAIYGNIYHQYTPFMLAYIPYMDPMGHIETVTDK